MANYSSVTNKLDLANNVQMEGDVEMPPRHYRMCYRRANKDWRLRIEGNIDGTPSEDAGDLYHVKNYEGEFNMNWFDGHSHFFHDGPIYLDKDFTAHLQNPVDVELAKNAPSD